MADTIIEILKVKLGVVTDSFSKGLAVASSDLVKFAAMAGKLYLGFVAWDVISKSVETLGNAVSLAGIAMSGLSAASIPTAARTQVLGTIVKNVGVNAGYTTEQINNAIDGIKKMGISTQEASMAVTRLTQDEIELSEGVKLARVAQDFAVQSGENSSEAYNRLMDAISTFNPMLLRTYGLTKTLNDVMSDYAKKNNIAADSLSQVQMKQALVNYVLEEGKKVTGSYEAAMGDANKKLGSMTRLFEELRNAIGQEALPIYSKLIDVQYKLLKKFDELEPATKKWISAFITIGGPIATIGGQVIKFTFGLASLGTLLTFIGPLLKGIGPVVGGVTTAMGLSGVATLSWTNTLAQLKTSIISVINVEYARIVALKAATSATYINVAAEMQSSVAKKMWIIASTEFKKTLVDLWIGFKNLTIKVYEYVAAQLAANAAVATYIGIAGLAIAADILIIKSINDHIEKEKELELEQEKKFERLLRVRSIHVDYLDEINEIIKTEGEWANTSKILNERHKEEGVSIEQMKFDLVSLRIEYNETEETLKEYEKRVRGIKETYGLATEEHKAQIWSFLQEQRQIVKTREEYNEYNKNLKESTKNLVLSIAQREADIIFIEKANYSLEKQANLYQLGLIPMRQYYDEQIESLKQLIIHIDNSTEQGKRDIEVIQQKIVQSTRNYADIIISEMEAEQQHLINIGKASSESIIPMMQTTLSKMANTVGYTNEQIFAKQRQIDEAQRNNIVKNYETTKEKYRNLLETNLIDKKKYNELMNEEDEAYIKRLEDSGYGLGGEEKRAMAWDKYKRWQSQRNDELDVWRSKYSKIFQLNEMELKDYLDREAAYYEAQYKAGIIDKEEYEKIKRNLEVQYKQVTNKELEKEVIRYQRWKANVDLGYYDNSLLEEKKYSNSMVFVWSEHNKKWNEILQERYNRTRKFQDDEKQMLLKHTVDLGNIYRDMIGKYTVTLSGVTGMNMQQLRSYQAEVFKVENEIYEHHLKEGEAELQNNIDITKKDLDMYQSKLKNYSRMDKQWQSEHKQLIDQVTKDEESARLKIDDLDAQLKAKQKARQEELEEGKKTWLQKIQDYLMKVGKTEQEIAEIELAKEINEIKRYVKDESVVRQYAQEKLNEIYKSTTESIREQADVTVNSFNDIRDSIKGAARAGEQWYKTVESFNTISGFGTAPKFGSVNMGGGKGGWGWGDIGSAGFGLGGSKGGGRTAEGYMQDWAGRDSNSSWDKYWRYMEEKRKQEDSRRSSFRSEEVGTGGIKSIYREGSQDILIQKLDKLINVVSQKQGINIKQDPDGNIRTVVQGNNLYSKGPT